MLADIEWGPQCRMAEPTGLMALRLTHKIRRHEVLGINSTLGSDATDWAGPAVGLKRQPSVYIPWLTARPDGQRRRRARRLPHRQRGRRGPDGTQRLTRGGHAAPGESIASIARQVGLLVRLGRSRLGVRLARAEG
jgi:hypothetical protein